MRVFFVKDYAQEFNFLYDWNRATITNMTVRSTELGQHTPHFAIAFHSKNFS